jgi:tRNA(Ile)-lysidine synthase
MLRKLELDFHRAAERLIADRSSLLAAVSGGGDSVALLHLLVKYARGRQIRLSVAHLDHGLRRGSRTDRKFVEQLAKELALPCFTERREVARLRRKDESPEESARRVRRAFLLETAAAVGSEMIATGHTLDDQAETVLMRLVRGAGATALTGMAERGPGPFVRPLLAIERERLREYLSRRELPFRRDPSNRDMRFDRNRVRRLVLPVLRESLNPRAARHLVKAAQRFREDAAFLDELARQALTEAVREERPGRLVLEAAALARQPVPIANRVARLALLRAGADGRRLATHHIDGLLDLASGGGGRELDLPGPLIARRIKKLIYLGSELC